MKVTRKGFLRLLGGSALATGAGKLVKAVAHAASVPAFSNDASRRRWGMAIDMQKCGKGCDDCARACRAAHNVPQIPDPAHEVKWTWHEPYEDIFPEDQTGFARPGLAASPLMVLCNHCEDPPCVRVCPTQATWKRSSDGIVMMDYHRCIGCRYCMAACPYGSRSFNWVDPRPYIDPLNPDYPTRTQGVVEKCNFCEERLGDGLLPACVEACGEKALVFGDLNDPNSSLRQVLASRAFKQRMPELGTGPSVFYLE